MIEAVEGRLLHLEEERRRVLIETMMMTMTMMMTLLTVGGDDKYRDINSYNVTDSISQPSLYVHQIRTTDMGGLTMRMTSTITMGEILQVII